MPKQIIISICGRAGSKGFKNKNLKTFCGKPLVYYTLSAAQMLIKRHSDINVDIVLNTDSEELKELVMRAYPEVHYIQRPEYLAGDAVAKMKVFQHSLEEMEKRTAKRYDCLLDLDITSPLRTVDDMSACLNTLFERDELNLVMSAVHSRRSPYMNMAKRVGTQVEQVIKTDFVARQQTPPCYDLNASIYAFRRDFLLTNTSGFLWDGACDVHLMEDTGILDIDSEEDFHLLSAIAAHLYETRPAFAQVRDNIASCE